MGYRYSMTLADIVRWFESLSPESVAHARDYYAEDARFKDPFNEVSGARAIERIYAHMFEQVRAPRFTVTGVFEGEGGAVLLWTFGYAGLAPARSIRGASHLTFGPDGRIRAHVDYWDPAEGIYERVPLLGALMRALKRRLAAPAG